MRGRMGAGDVGAAGVGARTLTRPCGRGLAQERSGQGLMMGQDAAIDAAMGAELGRDGRAINSQPTPRHC